MKLTWSVFPKFHKHLEPPRLAAFVRDVGLDTTNLVVREGYWATPKTLAADVPKFVGAMKGQGIEISLATTSYTPAELIKDPTPLQVFHDNGIRAFRLGYFPMTDDVRGALKRARGEMEELASLCDKHDVRGVYQLHHNQLVSSPSAAWPLVDGLPVDAIGVELDPGNQSFEGFEAYGKSARLLGKYLAWCSCKDSRVTRDQANAAKPDKGWKREWTPVYEGVVRWDEVFVALRRIEFDGVIKLMPFYDTGDRDAQEKKLKREVAYLKQIAAS
jgi:sugar phosphate isomerase/epimerase